MRKRRQAKKHEANTSSSSTNGKPKQQPRVSQPHDQTQTSKSQRRTGVSKQGYVSTKPIVARSPSGKVYQSSHHVKNILHRLYEDRNSTHGMCDMVLVAADQTFKVHRAVVAAASPFIRTLLVSGVSDGIYSSILLLSEYGSMTSHTLDLIVGYIYKGSIRLNHENVQGVMEAAETLQMKELKGFCRDYHETLHQANKVASNKTVSNRVKDINTQPEQKTDGPNGQNSLAPFTCRYCLRLFSRLDQYKRHKKNHELIYHRHWFKGVPISDEHCRSMSGQPRCVLERSAPAIQQKDARHVHLKMQRMLDHKDAEQIGLIIDTRGSMQVVSEKRRGRNNKKQRFACWKGCGKSFAREHFYLRHLERDCLNTLSRSRESANVDYTGQRGHYKCNECHKVFRFKSQVMRHLRNHSTLRPWECQNCDKSFKHREQLDIHHRTHTGEKPYQCTQCDKRFTHNSNLHVHIRRHLAASKITAVNCPVCNMLCESKVKMLTHLRNVHTIDKPYKCTDCGKSYRCESQLKLHTPTHQTARPYKCNQCNKSFKLKYILTAHERHTHTGKTYRCEFCSKEFRWKGYLNIHVRKHTGEKPYGCNRCGERFFYKYKLEKHEKIHTGELLAQDAPARTRSNAIVLQPKPDHKCDHCGAGFFQETDLTNHLRTDHMIQTIPKSILGENFFQDW